VIDDHAYAAMTYFAADAMWETIINVHIASEKRVSDQKTMERIYGITTTAVADDNLINRALNSAAKKESS
jgi:hypothetical protein